MGLIGCYALDVWFLTFIVVVVILAEKVLQGHLKLVLATKTR